MFVGESRTDEQHPAQEESGLHVKAHQLHLAYKDGSSPNIIKRHPVPLLPRGALQERPGARLCHVMAAVRGAAAAGDRAALTRHGQVQPPRPHCTQCYASPAETLFARRSQTQVPLVWDRSPLL